MALAINRHHLLAMSEDRTPEKLIAEALDVVALGYPHDGTPEEKDAFMADLRHLLEQRAKALWGEMRGR